MSKIALSGGATGTGTFTLTAPSSNTNRVVPLPDADGELVTVSSTQVLTNKSISAGQVNSGTLGLERIPTLTNEKIPNLEANKITGALNASGSAPIYACRAWVNFDGTTSPPTIRASGNVSSITVIGTGRYNFNFATAMPDANYSVAGFSSSDSGNADVGVIGQSGSALGRTASSFVFATFRAGSGGSSIRNVPFASLAVFR